MKIFMLIRFLNHTGAPKVFSWLANALSEHGHKITICTFGRSSEISLSDVIRYVDLSAMPKYRKLFAIRQILKKEKPDVAISFLLDANFYNILSCLGLQTKSVICERNDPFKPGYKKLKILKPLFRFADGAVFQIPEVKNFYTNITAPTAVIPNPITKLMKVSIPSFKEREDTIVTHGRLDIEQKRFDIMINAFKLLHNDYPDYRLLIYGKESIKGDKEKLERLIEKLNLKDSVFLMGESLQPLNDISKSKIWIMTSDFEGLPNALIEAMSIGMPCVATNCRPGGAASLITNDVNGLLVPRGDIRTIYEGLRYLIENPEKCDELSVEAKKINETLNAQRIVKLWEDYLRSVI